MKVYTQDPVETGLATLAI